jgi:hypothetical protein
VYNVIIDQPSLAVAYKGPQGASVAPTTAHTLRQRVVAAGPQCGQQGRSVFTGTSSVARKAEALRRELAVNRGHVMRIGDVWSPDPWRPHPV